MLGYLSLDIICSLQLTVFLELRSRISVRYSEQIMSAGKYPSIFSRQMEAIVYIFWRQMEAIVYSSPGQTIATCQHNISQHVATRWPNARNMLRPNNVAICCVDIMRSLGRGLPVVNAVIADGFSPLFVGPYSGSKM